MKHFPLLLEIPEDHLVPQLDILLLECYSPPVSLSIQNEVVTSDNGDLTERQKKA